MRHGKIGRKLGRKKANRNALMMNLASSLIKHKKIKTTDAKAKECKEDFEDALNNLFEVVKAEVIKEAAFFLESEPKVFNAWYRKNINSKMKRID